MNDPVKTDAARYAKASHTWTDPWADDKEVTCEYQFRRPSKSDISRFNKEVNKSPAVAQTNLLVNIVHPDDLDRMKTDLDKYPALLATLASWALKGSGLSDLGN